MRAKVYKDPNGVIFPWRTNVYRDREDEPFYEGAWENHAGAIRLAYEVFHNETRRQEARRVGE